MRYLLLLFVLPLAGCLHLHSKPATTIVCKEAYVKYTAKSGSYAKTGEHLKYYCPKGKLKMTWK